jgi:hypothetical protein
MSSAVLPGRAALGGVAHASPIQADEKSDADVLADGGDGLRHELADGHLGIAEGLFRQDDCPNHFLSWPSTIGLGCLKSLLDRLVGGSSARRRLVSAGMASMDG